MLGFDMFIKHTRYFLDNEAGNKHNIIDTSRVMDSVGAFTVLWQEKGGLRRNRGSRISSWEAQASWMVATLLWSSPEMVSLSSVWISWGGVTR